MLAVTSKTLMSNEVADSLLAVTSKLPSSVNEVTKTGILLHGSSYALSRHTFFETKDNVVLQLLKSSLSNEVADSLLSVTK